jgi:hypothetical protein
LLWLFWRWGSHKIFAWYWPSAVIFLISTCQRARTTGMSYGAQLFPEPLTWEINNNKSMHCLTEANALEDSEGMWIQSSLQRISLRK